MNVLRAIDARWEGVRLSTKRSNKIAGNPGAIAGIRWDDKAVRVLGQVEKGNK